MTAGGQTGRGGDVVRRFRSSIFVPENDFVKLLSRPGLGIFVRISQKKKIMDKYVFRQVHDVVSIFGDRWSTRLVFAGWSLTLSGQMRDVLSLSNAVDQ